MGWMCSWAAVEGVSKSRLLEGLNWEETGDHVDPGSGAAPFCIRERPNGWTVIFSTDFDWASRARILDLSRLGLTVGCQFEDKVEMECVATAAKDGVELWRVFHNGDPIDRLDVTGNPPPEFDAIREEFARQQKEDGDVDYTIEIPHELARVVCGYRPDDDDRDGDMAFDVVRPIGGEPAVKRGFLSRLLGRA